MKAIGWLRQWHHMDSVYVTAANSFFYHFVKGYCCFQDFFTIKKYINLTVFFSCETPCVFFYVLASFLLNSFVHIFCMFAVPERNIQTEVVIGLSAVIGCLALVFINATSYNMWKMSKAQWILKVILKLKLRNKSPVDDEQTSLICVLMCLMFHWWV